MKNDGKLKKIIFTVRVCVLSLSLSALTTLTCLAASPKDAKSVVSPPSSSSLKKPSPIPPPTPNAPSNLTAVALNSNAIHITWRDNANTERGFLIERSTSSDGLFMQIATLDANATSYDNAALTADTTYYYRVCAYTLGSTSAYSNTAYAKTLSTAAGGYLPVNKIAVSALIKFASPGVDTASLNLGNLTPAQITSLRKSLVDLQGKKFMVFKGAVVILTDIIIQVTNTNDIISMNILKNGVRKGTVELADLTGIRTFKPLDPFAPWYDYLYTVLENLVKKAAPGATMKAEGLNKSAKSYLDKRFAGVGGSENFEISAEDNYLSVDPKETNNLTGLDKFISMSFENDPLAYNKNAIIEYLQSFKDEIIDNDADFFYIAGEDVEGGAEFMS
ncbi:MAG: fibronectin type III domain-containing protein, partial [Candidatus Omnitrophica bacterium]|nr:fibronectin type III domain-containing protein [Candidatus Omnitrophota bacterium]